MRSGLVISPSWRAGNRAPDPGPLNLIFSQFKRRRNAGLIFLEVCSLGQKTTMESLEVPAPQGNFCPTPAGRMQGQVHERPFP